MHMYSDDLLEAITSIWAITGKNQEVIKRDFIIDFDIYPKRYRLRKLIHSLHAKVAACISHLVNYLTGN